MKLTKHEHACLEIQEAGDTLVIDPGAYTSPLVDLGHVVAIVITHEHADHYTSEQLDRILEGSPDARIFGPAGVAASASGYPVTVVADGDSHEVGAFSIRFFGEKHAVIHSSIPVIDNVGVLVNDTLYYAGDSFTVPPVTVDTLAVPAGAPWLKIGEVMDYVSAVAPRRSFPTHEAVLSPLGQGLSNTRIGFVTESAGGEFFALEPGGTLEL